MYSLWTSQRTTSDVNYVEVYTEVAQMPLQPVFDSINDIGEASKANLKIHKNIASIAKDVDH